MPDRLNAAARAPALDAGATFQMWLGPNQPEAVAAFRRARRAGMSLARALVVGQIASFRDCWAFRSKLARLLGVSVRTIQRAISEAKSLGLLKVFRAKPNEKAPELGKVIACGWSHRLTVGWGKAGAAVTEAIEAARLRFIARSSGRDGTGPRSNWIASSSARRRASLLELAPPTTSDGGQGRERGRRSFVHSRRERSGLQRSGNAPHVRSSRAPSRRTDRAIVSSEGVPTPRDTKAQQRSKPFGMVSLPRLKHRASSASSSRGRSVALASLVRALRALPVSSARVAARRGRPAEQNA